MMRMMKMAAVSTVTVLLLCCSVFASKGSQASCDYSVAMNDDFTVPLHNAPQNLNQLRWTHESTLIFYRRSDMILQGNAKDVLSNGSLRLTNLDKSKAGKYTPEVYTENGKAVPNLKSVTLCVFDRVPKPKVMFKCLPPSSVKFTCTAGQNQDLKFEWVQDNNILDEVKGRTLEKTIKDVGTHTISCKVSNSVSFLISAPVQHNCVQPGHDLPELIPGINSWIIVGGGGGVVLLLIITVIVCCVCNRRKKRMHVKDEEELRLGWTNTNQQHPPQQHSHPPGQHHHHHHHQQQPAGHTGPRQHRSKQPRSQQRPRAPDQPNGQPQPSPRRPAQAPRPTDTTDDEKPPPLPQPRKKAPKTPRV
ncbi:T-cell surface antigen CD2-like isoform X2 [Chaetodon auriga]|uniref:T-cell surface antigen CD2-like isoform X2 n=1 Tax=Chaetodon auriga TaxID=39042 RepID=UPI0040329A07